MQQTYSKEKHEQLQLDGKSNPMGIMQETKIFIILTNGMSTNQNLSLKILNLRSRTIIETKYEWIFSIYN